MLRRAHLHWVKLPGDKKRPVLVLSPEARNQAANDVIVVPLSSVLRYGPWHVRLDKGEAGMPRASVIQCEQITTVHKDYVVARPIGTLSPARMAEVERGILFAIGMVA